MLYDIYTLPPARSLDDIVSAQKSSERREKGGEGGRRIALGNLLMLRYYALALIVSGVSR